MGLQNIEVYAVFEKKNTIDLVSYTMEKARIPFTVFEMYETKAHKNRYSLKHEK